MRRVHIFFNIWGHADGIPPQGSASSPALMVRAPFPLPSRALLPVYLPENVPIGNYVYSCMYTYIHIYIYTHPYIHMYICIYVCTYITHIYLANRQSLCGRSLFNSSVLFPNIISYALGSSRSKKRFSLT